mmetsp:Transcript_3319/g.6752  ORF Transcript_3319/g.6752 Transcript_3319/m.6752 type:complete len:117 (+) Transcript_3319:174-524(+)
MALKRYQRFLAVLIPYISFYIYHITTMISSPTSYPRLLFNAFHDVLLSLHSPSESVTTSFLTLSPFISLALIGLYALADISYCVYNFNDCKDAKKEIDRQVEEGKRAMRERGVKIR